MKFDYKGLSTCALVVALGEVLINLIRMYPLRETLVGNTALGFLFTVISFALFVAGLWYYKKHYNTEFFSFNYGLKSGMIMGIFYAVILAAFLICIYTFDSQYVNELKELAKQSFAMSGLPADQVKQAYESSQWMFSPWYIGVSALIGCWISAFFYSLIGMIFLKEKEDYYAAMKEVESEDED